MTRWHAPSLQRRSTAAAASRRPLFALEATPGRCRRASWYRPAYSGAQEQDPSPSSSQTFEYTYKGSDGRLKATFEQAFKGGYRGSEGIQPAGGAAAPWAVGYQMSEAGLMWNDDLKARLVKRIMSDRLGVGEEEVEARLRQLDLLLPTLRQKAAGMKPELLARLAANVPGVAAAIIQLKGIFPEADVSKLAVRQPALVLGFDMGRLQRIAEELRSMLPRLNVDRLVEENPSMLDVEGFRLAVAEARRIMPFLDIQQALSTDPQMIFGFQRGAQLIPYDEPRPVSEEEQQQADDDEYSQYYKW